MNFIINKLNQTFRDKKVYFFMVLIMFCLGISFGLYAVKYMNESNRNDLISYFSGFTSSIGDTPIDYGNLLFNVIKKNMLIIIPIFIFGLTFFGMPFILILDMLKGFTLGYTFSFIMTTFEGKGIGLALVSVIPQNLIYIPCFIALSVIALSFSTQRFKGKFFKRTNVKDPFLNLIGNKLIIILAVFTIGILIETYVSPNLIKFVVTKFY
ncbi:stage II sporulation protein M [Clostridium uliginosum]|uniref:Stage II sporulation protein M n=1 Tax=Clostridium uliginosum TaxID=119641 RepID=A0A1I1HPJ6_9CLOT|nr:stage II sporulation protein M [Clostridium uliginosum]SFC23363.1 stage II sporulation protein M [Clostridium uliginosum]